MKFPSSVATAVFSLVVSTSLPFPATASEPIPSCGDANRHFDPTEVPVAPVGSGTVYYVDAANGKDTNNGTSEQTAFKTIGKAVNDSAAVIGPGATVRIKAGLYRERLNITKSGTASQRIVVGAFGNGPVVLDGSTAVTGWTQVSGQIYKATPGFAVTAVVVDDQPVFPEFSQAALVEGRWYYDGTNLYLWCPGGGSPANHDVGVIRDYEYENTIYLNPSSYITLYGLTVRFSGGNAINVWGTNVRIEKCRVIFAGKTGISLFNYGSINTDNAEIIKNELYHNFLRNWPRGGEYKFGGWGMGATSNGTLNALFQGNVSHKNGGEGLGGYAGPGGTIYRDNVVYDNWSVDIYVDNQPNVLVENNFLYSNQPDPGDLYNNGDTNPSDGQNVKRLRPEGIVTADENYGNGTHLSNVTIRNNVIVGCRRGYNHYHADALTTSALKNVDIVGNTIVVPADLNTGEQVISGMIVPWNGGQNTGSLIADNVIYATNPNTDLLHREDGPSSGDSFVGTTFSNNSWFHTTRSKPFHWGPSYNPNYDYDHSGWAALAGAAHSAGDIADPQLIDPVTVDDVASKAPAGSSPALDGGIDTGVPYDYDFCPRPQGGGYDIGAFEGSGAPGFRIADASVKEGDTGTTNAVFTVTLRPAATADATVHYATADVTGHAGTDYTATSGDLTFPAGTTSGTVSVPVIGNIVVDGNRTFAVNLSAAVGADIARGSATGTILDDDVPQPLQFSAAGYSVSEADGSATVTVTRSGASVGTVTVAYATSNGTATAGSDYTATSGTLTFAPGVTSQSFSVPVLPDLVKESTETVNLTLSAPASPGVLGSRKTAVLSIQDSAPQVLAFSSGSYKGSEALSAATISVKRTGARTGTVTVDYTTYSGTAVAGTDYTPVSGTLTFKPGVAARTFAIPILRDVQPESAETVLVALKNPTGGFLGAQHTAVLTIIDNDHMPTVQFSARAYSVSEAGGQATIAVHRTGDTSAAASVVFATANGTGVAGVDYTTTTSTVSFPPGAVSETLQVPVIDNGNGGPNKTVNLSLSNPQGVLTGSPAAAILTIANNDAAVQFSASAYTVGEAMPQAVISVKRTGSASGTITVSYGTANGTASAGSDYTATSGVLTFAPHVLTRSFAVPILNDTIDEGSETINLTLSGAVGGTIVAPSTAVLTILDNEPTIQFSAAAYKVSEALKKATIVVKRTGDSSGTATVHYATSNGTATAGSDYTSTSGTLTFLPRVVTHTISIPIVSDLVDEPDETVNLTLSSPTSAKLGTPASAILTITDNDRAGTIQFGATVYSVGEGDGSASVTVTRSGGSSAASISFSTSNGTAVAGADYTAVSTTVSFAAGETSKTVVVPIVDDAVAEPAKYLNLTLSSPSYGVVLGAQSNVALWIVDND